MSVLSEKRVCGCAVKTHLNKLRASIEQMKEVNALMQSTNPKLQHCPEWKEFYEATREFRQFVAIIVFLGSGRRK